MRIYPNKIESFLRDPGPDVSAVLVFGPDRGLVRERLAQLLKSTAGDPEDPFRLARLAASRVIEDPRCLYDEAAALPLTGGRRVVVIDETGDELADTFSDFLTDAVVDSLVLVGSGDLPPRSRLRQLFERARRAAALPCYPDDERSLRRLIGQYLGDASVTADSQAVAYLAANLGGDRELVRRELEKLAL
ncbi:MAG: DNA polymerase III subunit delta, partial [Alphaproteobacteria bacterium]